MSRLTLTVSGMSCAGCEQRVRTVLGRVDGVGAVEADHAAGTVVVDYDPAAVDEAALRERLEDAGYEPLAERGRT